MAKVGLLNFPYFAILFLTCINIKRHWLYGEVKFDEVDKIKRKNSKGWFPKKCVILSDKLDESPTLTTATTSDKKTD
jgi:hypothetical protein